MPNTVSSDFDSRLRLFIRKLAHDLPSFWHSNVAWLQVPTCLMALVHTKQLTFIIIVGSHWNNYLVDCSSENVVMSMLCFFSFCFLRFLPYCYFTPSSYRNFSLDLALIILAQYFIKCVWYSMYISISRLFSENKTD